MESGPDRITGSKPRHGPSSVSDRRLIARLRGIWVDQNARWSALRFQRRWRLREANGLAGRMAARIRDTGKPEPSRRCFAAARLLSPGKEKEEEFAASSPYLLHPREFRDQVNAVIARTQAQIACVLNMYIDAYKNRSGQLARICAWRGCPMVGTAHYRASGANQPLRWPGILPWRAVA